ncbi:hypothetical protein CsSME_00053475 [Camellia sinensis var. sinensis]
MYQICICEYPMSINVRYGYFTDTTPLSKYPCFISWKCQMSSLFHGEDLKESGIQELKHDVVLILVEEKIISVVVLYK